MLDPIRKTLTVPCNQQQAFEIFLEDMPNWWPLAKRSMSVMNVKELPKGLRVEAKEGGQIVETAADDTEYLWGTITRYKPYSALAMDFHMGMPKENASLVEVEFEEIGPAQTQVRLIHSRWEAFGDLAEMMRGGYGSSWDLILEEGYLPACEAATAPAGTSSWRRATSRRARRRQTLGRRRPQQRALDIDLPFGRSGQKR